MKAAISWATDLTKPDRPEWEGELDCVPRVGDSVTIYGPEVDEDGFHEMLEEGTVKVVSWGLNDDRTADVSIRLI